MDPEQNRTTRGPEQKVRGLSQNGAAETENHRCPRRHGDASFNYTGKLPQDMRPV